MSWPLSVEGYLAERINESPSGPYVYCSTLGMAKTPTGCTVAISPGTTLEAGTSLTSFSNTSPRVSITAMTTEVRTAGLDQSPPAPMAPPSGEAISPRWLLVSPGWLVPRGQSNRTENWSHLQTMLGSMRVPATPSTDRQASRHRRATATRTAPMTTATFPPALRAVRRAPAIGTAQAASTTWRANF